MSALAKHDRIDLGAPTQCGSFTDSEGNGEVNLGLYHKEKRWPWIDLLKISYSAPTKEQLAEMLASNIHSRSFVNYHRRVSKVQAEFLCGEIGAFLAERFKDGIPSDEEIEQLLTKPVVAEPT